MSQEIKIAIEKMVLLELDELVDFQGNLKSLTTDRYNALRKEMLDRGFSFAPHAWLAPDGKHYLLDGHQRKLTLCKMRDEGIRVPKIPTVLVQAETYDQAKRKLLSAVAQYGQIDRQGLYEFTELAHIPIGELETYPLPDLDMADFKAEYYEDEADKNGGAGNEPGAAPAVPKSQPGDLWTLGRHRLLCGDATNPKDVDRVTQGLFFVLTLTDPPYSVDYDQSHEDRGDWGHGKHGGRPVESERPKQAHAGYQWDKPGSETEVLSFLSLVPSDVVIMTYPVDRHFFALADAVRAAGFEFRKEIVWVKDVFAFWMGAKYQQRHEPILWLAKKGKPMGGEVPANLSTVLEYPRPRAHDLHPTAKPVDMWEGLVQRHVPEEHAFFEPFCGSGTGIVAAENLKRICAAIEKSPQYVDVTIERWCSMTGEDAIRHDGVKWSSLKQKES